MSSYCQEINELSLIQNKSFRIRQNNRLIMWLISLAIGIYKMI